jgi:hypothetical protein
MREVDMPADLQRDVAKRHAAGWRFIDGDTTVYQHEQQIDELLSEYGLELARTQGTSDGYEYKIARKRRAATHRGDTLRNRRLAKAKREA